MEKEQLESFEEVINGKKRNLMKETPYKEGDKVKILESGYLRQLSPYLIGREGEVKSIRFTIFGNEPRYTVKGSDFEIDIFEENLEKIFY